MQLTRFRTFLLIGGSLTLLGPAIGLGQPGPGGGFQAQPGGFPGGSGGFPGGGQRGQRGGNNGGGNRQGGGGRQFDPNMIFNMISGGKDYIDVQQYLPMAQMRDPNAADKINEFMQRMGISNGILTRDQFAQFMQERMAQRQAQRDANPNGQNPNDPNNPAAKPDTTTDENGEPPPPEDKRSVVYRAGNLPQGMPTWFAAYDTDQDGQVALYEWKAQGRSVSDFQNIDLNGDGFITIDEALRYQKTQGPVVASNGFPGQLQQGGYPGMQQQGGFPGQQGGFPGGGQRGQRGQRGGNNGGANGGQRGQRGQRGAQQYQPGQ